MAHDPRPVCGFCERPLTPEGDFWVGDHIGGCIYHEDPAQRRAWAWAETPTRSGSLLPIEEVSSA